MNETWEGSEATSKNLNMYYRYRKEKYHTIKA